MIDVVQSGTAARRRRLAWLGIAVMTGSQLLVGSPTTLVYCLMLEIAYVLFVAVSRREGWPSLAVLGALAVATRWHPGDPDPGDHTGARKRSREALEAAADPHQCGRPGDAVLALILALGRHTGLYRLFLELPVIALLGVPSRYSVMIYFAGAILAAIAFSDLLRGNASREARRRSWCIWIVPAMSWLIALVAVHIRHNPAGWGYAEVAASLSTARFLMLSPLAFTCTVMHTDGGTSRRGESAAR